MTHYWSTTDPLPINLWLSTDTALTQHWHSIDTALTQHWHSTDSALTDIPGIPTVPRPNNADYLLVSLAAMAAQLPVDPNDLLYSKVWTLII